MSDIYLGRTLVIANPAAHSGRGETAALFVTRFFSTYHTAADSCEVRLTEAPGDALAMARQTAGYDTVVALGGDGVVHEVASGLMRIPEAFRPRLAIIPMGTGNDFARTLNMKRSDPEKAIAELLRGSERSIDLGKVNDAYFIQTLSFGLDARIALDTSDRRANNARQQGAGLFVTSGIKLLPSGLNGWPYRVSIDGQNMEGLGIVFAIQNGPTYGGGFKVCPSARPDDGMLDLCCSVSKPSLAHSIVLFEKIHGGRHTKSNKLFLSPFKHLEVEFTEEQPPCQIDGERFEADRYVVDVVPNALRVIVPPGCPW
jgi:YegS/Rv2252/BmrU family lipid kinase